MSCRVLAGRWDMPHKSDRLDPSAPVFGVPPKLSTFPTGVVVEFAFSLPHSSPQSNIPAKGNARIRSTSRTRTPRYQHSFRQCLRISGPLAALDFTKMSQCHATVLGLGLT